MQDFDTEEEMMTEVMEEVIKKKFADHPVGLRVLLGSFESFESFESSRKCLLLVKVSDEWVRKEVDESVAWWHETCTWNETRSEG
jgi:hypothetical protein